MRFRVPVFTASLLALVSAGVAAAGLPDTGQQVCDDGTNVLVPCTAANSGDAATYPRQDGRFGADAAAAAGTLVKIGAGAAGFDYTKIANNGASLPLGALLGTGPDDWACTRDNVTGLVWEVKTATNPDLRNWLSAYTWYSTDNATNAGATGVTGGFTCQGLPGNLCNTEAFVTAVNAATLCGNADWRLPSVRELHTLIHFGVADPSIDGTYFPNTTSTSYWTSSSKVSGNPPAEAWSQDFSSGVADDSDKTSTLRVRLVRGGSF